VYVCVCVSFVFFFCSVSPRRILGQNKWTCFHETQACTVNGVLVQERLARGLNLFDPGRAA
jgi:hypothetical protein